jgi:hypothetical protein
MEWLLLLDLSFAIAVWRRTESIARTTAKGSTIMKTNTTKENGKSNPVSEVADTVLKNYEQAVRTGLKLQEEAGRWWSSMLNHTACAPDLQKRFTSMTGVANSLLPLAQKRTEEVMALVEKNSRTGTELFKKAVDAAQTPVIADSQAKWMDFFTASIGAARDNTEALTQMGSKAVDSWIDFVQKNTEVTEIRVPKAA